MTKEERFEENMNLAYKIANKYLVNYEKEIEDIRQIALLGLWKAVLTFEPVCAFSTYAYPVISNEINYYLRTLKRKTCKNLSLCTPVYENDTIEDILVADDFTIEGLLDEMERREICECFNRTEFTELEKKVWNLMDQGHTQKQIGNMLGHSQSWIHRVYKRSYSKGS